MENLVIFDIDGTLLKKDAHIAKAVNAALHSLSLPEVAGDRIVGLTGVPLARFYEAIAPGFGDIPKLEAALARCEEEALRERGGLYEGVVDMLAALCESGYDLATCSNGNGDYVHMVLDLMGIKGYFKYPLSGHGFPSKDKAIAAHLSLGGYEKVIMVGDRAHDFQAAKALNIPSIGVTYGYGTGEELAQATHLASSPRQVLGLILHSPRIDPVG